MRLRNERFPDEGNNRKPTSSLSSPRTPCHSRERGNPRAAAWIPGLRSTPPGMTGWGSGRRVNSTHRPGLRKHLQQSIDATNAHSTVTSSRNYSARLRGNTAAGSAELEPACQLDHVPVVLIPFSSGHSVQPVPAGRVQPPPPRLNPFSSGHSVQPIAGQHLTLHCGLNPFFIRAFGSTTGGCESATRRPVLIPFSSGHSVQRPLKYTDARRVRS